MAGGRLYFFVLTQPAVEELKAFGEEFLQEIGGIQGYLRSFNRDLARALDVPGMVVGPNWVAMSDWRVTLRAVHQAIGGKLIILDPSSSPGSSRTEPQ